MRPIILHYCVHDSKCINISHQVCTNHLQDWGITLHICRCAEQLEEGEGRLDGSPGSLGGRAFVYSSDSPEGLCRAHYSVPTEGRELGPWLREAPTSKCSHLLPCPQPLSDYSKVFRQNKFCFLAWLPNFLPHIYEHLWSHFTPCGAILGLRHEAGSHLPCLIFTKSQSDTSFPLHLTP